MPTDPEYEKYLEKRAEELGLPTDPEAYQDGGFAVMVNVFSRQEAENVAQQLNRAGVPAWVDGDNAAEGGPAIQVIVPRRRRADAEAVLTRQAPQVLGPARIKDETLLNASLAIRGVGLTVLGGLLTLTGVAALFSRAFYEDATALCLGLGALCAGLVFAAMGVQRLRRSSKANE